MATSHCVCQFLYELLSQLSVVSMSTNNYRYQLLVWVVMHLLLSVCVSLSVCPVHALTFESLDLETLFLVCRYTLRISVYISVIGGQCHTSQKVIKVVQA